ALGLELDDDGVAAGALVEPGDLPPTPVWIIDPPDLDAIVGSRLSGRDVDVVVEQLGAATDQLAADLEAHLCQRPEDDVLDLQGPDADREGGELGHEVERVAVALCFDLVGAGIELVEGISRHATAEGDLTWRS